MPPRVVQALDDAYTRLQELMPVEFPAAQSGDGLLQTRAVSASCIRLL